MLTTINEGTITMKKTTTDIHEKIAVRAYFAWLAGSTAGSQADWLAAEQIERAYAARRAATARKAAETRNAKKIARAPAEMLVVATRSPVRRPTAH